MPNLSKPLPVLTAEQIARFWSKVSKGDPAACWLWKGDDSNRYRAFYVGGGRYVYAHRLAHFITTGRDPSPNMVIHSCDVPACCNPAHLRAGTAADNVRDAQDRGRMPKAKPKPPPSVRPIGRQQGRYAVNLTRSLERVAVAAAESAQGTRLARGTAFRLLIQVGIGAVRTLSRPAVARLAANGAA